MPSDRETVYRERECGVPSVAASVLHLAPILQRLGELHEARGNRTKAIEYYSRFVELWRNADPERQPRVTAVRRRIEDLRKGH